MNKAVVILLAGVVLAACEPEEEDAWSVTPGARSVIGSIDRLDARVEAIVPESAALEILAEGHEWTEGPVWVPALQAVLYSDIPNNAIYRWSEGAPASQWLHPAGYTSEPPRGWRARVERSSAGWRGAPSPCSARGPSHRAACRTHGRSRARLRDSCGSVRGTTLQLAQRRCHPAER